VPESFAQFSNWSSFLFAPLSTTDYYFVGGGGADHRGWSVFSSSLLSRFLSICSCSAFIFQNPAVYTPKTP
jgi:hypothetical protein